MIAFLSFTKSFAGSGLVNRMAIMSRMGEYSMDLDPFMTLPEIKKYQRLRCLDRLDGDRGKLAWTKALGISTMTTFCPSVAVMAVVRVMDSKMGDGMRAVKLSSASKGALTWASQ